MNAQSFVSYSGQNIEEAGASNFFAVFHKSKTIVTPPLETNTILPGITRSSIIELAKSVIGWNVEERNINIHELKDADEAFCCGTGASITPVGMVSYWDGEFPNEQRNSQSNSNENFVVCFGDGSAPGKITESLYKLLLGLQNGDLNDEKVIKKYSSWIHVVEP